MKAYIVKPDALETRQILEVEGELFPGSNTTFQVKAKDALTQFAYRLGEAPTPTNPMTDAPYPVFFDSGVTAAAYLNTLVKQRRAETRAQLTQLSDFIPHVVPGTSLY